MKGPGSGPLLASVAAAVLTLAACTAHLHAFQAAVHGWHGGDRAGALTSARAEYARYRDANDLDESALRRLVDEVRRDLSETPIALAPTPSPVAIDAEAPPVQPGDVRPPSVLRDQLRADLLSGNVTPMLRAANVVMNLSLDRHAIDLLAVVFRREPVADDGGLLSGADTATRSVATKRLALDGLEALAAAPP